MAHWEDALDRVARSLLPRAPDKQTFVEPPPKWGRRKVIRHLLGAIAVGSVVLSLGHIYEKQANGWQKSTVSVCDHDGKREVYPLATTVFILNGTTTWPVPADFGALVSVEAIGAGSSGNASGTAGSRSGGGGGAYAKITSTSTTLTPGVTSINVGVGLGGVATSSTTGNAGGDTWWNATSLANAVTNGSAVSVASQAGQVATSTVGAPGGLAASSVGTTKFSGGTGAHSSTGSGGGAAGPSGAGSVGTSTIGGAADNSTVAAPASPAAGNSGTEFDGSHGCGTGASGNGSTAFAGGTYGGGGSASVGGASGIGGNGLLVITYTPSAVKFINNAADAIFPRRLFTRRGATMRGDDGIAAPKTFVATAAWHIQPPQPPRPKLLLGAIAAKDDGNYQQYAAFRPLGAFQVQPWQPPSPLRSNKKYGAIVSDDDGNADALRQFKDMGFEIAPPPLLRLPTLYRSAAAIMAGDDGTYRPYALWLNVGYEVQPHQPQHPRPERAGAIAAGDDGDEYPFIFTVATPAWQFSAQEFQPPGARVRQRGSAFPDDPSGFNDQPPLVNFYPAGWEIQAVQPPHRRPERFGAIAPREDGIERPLVNLYPMGWEVQPPQPLQPPVGKARIRAAIMRGDDGTIRPLVVQLAAGWEIQSVQPPRFLPWYRRAAALMIGDDGTYRQYASWRNFEWGVQNFQPPHPHPEQRFAAIAPRDDGITATYSTWQNAGWEIQSPQPPTQPSVRKRAPGAAGRSLFASPGLFVPMGWEIAAPNPQHLRRFNSLPIQDIDAAFVAPAFVPPFGWEIHPPPPPRFPSANRRAGAIAPRDDGIQYPLLRFLGFGFENQPWQPKHPRPERSAAFLLGDDGIEGTFFVRPLTAWGYEQPFLFPRYPVPRRAAALAGAENVPAVLRRLAPMGWEPTPPFFRHPRPERAGAIMAGDSGAEAPFVARVAAGWGFEPPVLALRRAIARGAGLAARAEGTEAAFQFFRPMGWEPSEPIRRPRRGWHGPQIFEPPGDGLLPFRTPLWIDARTDQLRPWARFRGGALAGPWLAEHVEARAFTLDGLDWWPPETFYRRRRVGGALPYEGGWMLPRFVSVFYASTVLTRASGLVTATQGYGESVLSRAGAAPEVSQASGQTVATAAAGQTVVKGEQRGQ